MVLSLRTAQGLVFSKPDNMIHLPVKTFPDPRLAIASEVRPHLTDERNRRLRRVVLGFLVYHWFASLSEPSLPLKRTSFLPDMVHAGRTASGFTMCG